METLGGTYKMWSVTELTAIRGHQGPLKETNYRSSRRHVAFPQLLDLLIEILVCDGMSPDQMNSSVLVKTQIRKIIIVSI